MATWMETATSIWTIARFGCTTFRTRTFGDSNLDGIFDSQDLVTIFAAGEYEDAVVGNSTWYTGDWNMDDEFNSKDLVLALQDGGYQAAAATAAVPEPAAGRWPYLLPRVVRHAAECPTQCVAKVKHRDRLGTDGFSGHRFGTDRCEAPAEPRETGLLPTLQVFQGRGDLQDGLLAVAVEHQRVFGTQTADWEFRRIRD